MQIIEMYEPDEDLKKKGNKNFLSFFLFEIKYATLKTLRFLIKSVCRSSGVPQNQGTLATLLM